MINDNDQIPRTTCTCNPHGFYSLIPATLSFAAWVASLSQDGCDFASISGPIVSEILLTTTGDAEDSNSVPYLEFGFNGYRIPQVGEEEEWYIDYTSNCHDYEEIFVKRDIYWDLSRILSFLSLVLGGGGAIFLWFSTCFIFSPATWRWTGYEILVAAMLQLGSFLWFNTAVCQDDPDNVCRLRFGSKSDIVAGTLWLVSATVMLMKYPSPRIKSVAGRGDDCNDKVQRNVQHKATSPRGVDNFDDNLGRHENKISDNSDESRETRTTEGELNIV